MAADEKKPESGVCIKNYEAPFRALYEGSGMGISLVDLGRHILDVNPAFERMLGYSNEELVGKTFAGILYPEDSPLNLELHRQLLAGERETYHMERRYIRKDKSILWTRLTVSLLRDAKGQAELTIGMIEDITEQKEAEAKIHEQQSQLEQAAKMSALGEMASGIAHEINNPLNVIQFRGQHASAILKKGVSEASVAQVFTNMESIQKNVNRIISIVKGLQSFARKGDQDPMEMVEIDHLIDEALELSGQRLRYKDIRLHVHRLGKGHKVECRPTQILQVLVNLINNAGDAVGDLSEKWIAVEAHELDEAVEIRVTDSGKGIAEDVVQKMFQTFFTTKPSGKGTGLGLSISKGILESHRGALRVDAQHINTRFIIGLPKRQNKSYLAVEAKASQAAK